MKTDTTNGSSGTFIKGQTTSLKILTSAEDILLGRGYHDLSLRNIAKKAGISISNLQYYFPSKDELIKALLDRIIETYLGTFQGLRDNAKGHPEEQFSLVISWVINELSSKRTTSFFPELWALANHNKHASERMEEMYAKYRAVIQEIISEINTGLTEEQAWKLALFITSSIEGHTVFIGHGKPWKKHTEDINKIANKSFLHIIRNPPF